MLYSLVETSRSNSVFAQIPVFHIVLTLPPPTLRPHLTFAFDGFLFQDGVSGSRALGGPLLLRRAGFVVVSGRAPFPFSFFLRFESPGNLPDDFFGVRPLDLQNGEVNLERGSLNEILYRIGDRDVIGWTFRRVHPALSHINPKETVKQLKLSTPGP